MSQTSTSLLNTSIAFSCPTLQYTARECVLHWCLHSPTCYLVLQVHTKHSEHIIEEHMNRWTGLQTEQGLWKTVIFAQLLACNLFRAKPLGSECQEGMASFIKPVRTPFPAYLPYFHPTNLYDIDQSVLKTPEFTVQKCRLRLVSTLKCWTRNYSSSD